MEQVEMAKSHQKHRSASEWRVLVDGWRASGKTRDIWCREQGIGRESLRRWTKRLRRTDAEPVLVELRRDAVSPQKPMTAHVRIMAKGDIDLIGEFSDEVLRRVLSIVREAVDVC